MDNFTSRMKALKIICFTVWVIATEFMLVDLQKCGIKAALEANTVLFREAGRSLHPAPVPSPQRERLEGLDNL